MLPMGFLITVLAYGIGEWGFFLVKGYNISIRQVLSPFHSYGSAGEPWPPPPIPLGTLLPGSASAASTTTTGTGTGSGTGTGKGGGAGGGGAGGPKK